MPSLLWRGCAYVRTGAWSYLLSSKQLSTLLFFAVKRLLSDSNEYKVYYYMFNYNSKDYEKVIYYDVAMCNSGMFLFVW